MVDEIVVRGLLPFLHSIISETAVSPCLQKLGGARGTLKLGCLMVWVGLRPSQRRETEELGVERDLHHRKCKVFLVSECAVVLGLVLFIIMWFSHRPTSIAWTYCNDVLSPPAGMLKLTTVDCSSVRAHRFMDA